MEGSTGSKRRALGADDTVQSRGLSQADDEQLEPFIKQFDLANRKNAAHMSRYYEIFYLLENDIRRLIVETMESAHGGKWWDSDVTKSPTFRPGSIGVFAPRYLPFRKTLRLRESGRRASLSDC